MQMVENAGLMFGDASPSFILAYMLTMARQEDGRVSIQQTSDSWVQHNRQGAANGLVCQTNCFRQPARSPARPAKCRLDALRRLICTVKLATSPLDSAIGAPLRLANHRVSGRELAFHHFADSHHARAIELVALVRTELGSRAR